MKQIANGELRMANRDGTRAKANSQFAIRNSQLTKVFFSDDGSTAMEVALKLAYEFTRRTRGPKSKPRFLSLTGAYHGDTVGAVSLGHITSFTKPTAGCSSRQTK